MQFGHTYDLVYLICHIESFKMAYDTIAPKLHNFFNAAKRHIFLVFSEFKICIWACKWIIYVEIKSFQIWLFQFLFLFYAIPQNFASKCPLMDISVSLIFEKNHKISCFWQMCESSIKHPNSRWLISLEYTFLVITYRYYKQISTKKSTKLCICNFGIKYYGTAP